MRLLRLETKINQLSELLFHLKTRFIIGLVILFIVLPTIFVATLSAHETFDAPILSFFADLRSENLDIFFSFITNFGGHWLMLASAFLAIWLLTKKHYLYAGVLLIGGLNAYLLKIVLKLIYQRERPQIFESLLFEESFSYPSGHAFASTLFWGFLAWIITRHLNSKLIKILITLLAILIILLVGVSRVYLSVHWPSDVVAGWILGAWWLYFILGFFRDYEALKK